MSFTFQESSYHFFLRQIKITSPDKFPLQIYRFNSFTEKEDLKLAKSHLFSNGFKELNSEEFKNEIPKTFMIEEKGETDTLIKINFK